MVRRVSVFVRAVHLLAVAAVGGACLLGGDATHAWWILAAASGLGLLATEYVQHRRLHREVCGGATLLKLLLVGAIAAAPSLGPWLMGGAIFIAAVGAHAPKTWRHQRVF